MKKVLVILIVCCCALMVHAQSGWPFSQSASMPYAQMTSTSPSMMASQGHERLSQACHTSFSTNHTSVQDIETQGRGGVIHRVGPNKPNEPGAPVGDGMSILLLLVVLYGCLLGKKKRSHRA